MNYVKLSIYAYIDIKEKISTKCTHHLRVYINKVKYANQRTKNETPSGYLPHSATRINIFRSEDGD